MKNILIIGKKSKRAFENLKKVNHKRINKTLDDFIKLISKNKKIIIRENAKDVKRLKRKMGKNMIFFGKNLARLSKKVFMKILLYLMCLPQMAIITMMSFQFLESNIVNVLFCAYLIDGEKKFFTLFTQMKIRGKAFIDRKRLQKVFISMF